jgi:hypothetical protein
VILVRALTRVAVIRAEETLAAETPEVRVTNTGPTLFEGTRGQVFGKWIWFVLILFAVKVLLGSLLQLFGVDDSGWGIVLHIAKVAVAILVASLVMKGRWSGVLVGDWREYDRKS